MKKLDKNTLPLYLQSLEKPSFLIIRLKPIGDTVLTTPVFRNIKRLYPNSKIDIVIFPEVYDIVENNPYIDKIIVLKRSILSKGLYFLRFLFLKYNVIIDYINNPTSLIISFLTHADFIIGNKKKRNFFYNYRIDNEEVLYSAIRCLKKLDIIGLDSYEDYMPEILISDRNRKSADIFYTKNGSAYDKYVGIFVSAKYPAKTYPAECFAALANLLIKYTSFRILFLFGKDDYETYSIIRDKTWNTDRIVYREPTTRLGELTALLSRLSFLIICDNGPKHIATALGVPVLTIFGASNEKKWNPPDVKTFPAIRKKMTCAPCGKNYCPDGTTSCLNDFSPDEIFAACIKSLSELGLISVPNIEIKPIRENKSLSIDRL